MRCWSLAATAWFESILLSSVLTIALSIPASATQLMNDPGGFAGIPWGSSLDEASDLSLVAPGDRVKGYERKDGSSQVGDARVDSMRFLSLNGKFARVVIHYRGKQIHKQVLAYLEGQFGSTERQPGSMIMRGLNQQYTWQGPESQITLTYEDQDERGSLFFESRLLAPRFLETMGGG